MLPWLPSLGLATARAGFADQDAPLVGGPADDEPAALRAVAEGVEASGTALEMFLGVGRELLGILLGVAGLAHGVDGLLNELQGCALDGHGASVLRGWGLGREMGVRSDWVVALTVAFRRTGVHRSGAVGIKRLERVPRSNGSGIVPIWRCTSQLQLLKLRVGRRARP